MRVSERCYAVLGLAMLPPWGANAGIVAGDARTLVVDTGPTALAAATIAGYAAAVRPGNALVAINTERHLDHLAGNATFRDLGADVYGHASIARTQEEHAADVADFNACIPNDVRRERGEAAVLFAGTRIANPNRPLTGDTTLDLGGLTVQVVLTPGHTPANLAVFVPTEGVAFCGDLVVSDYLPNLESGGPDDWRLWLASLDRLESPAPRAVVPGHGRVLREGDIASEIARTRAVLAEAISTGRAPTVR
jgi:cyclase